MTPTALSVLGCAPTSCGSCARPIHATNSETIDLIASQYADASAPWYVGFSGGKDSSALMCLLYEALRRSVARSAPVTIVYCDTGVDIPVVTSLVKTTLAGLAVEAEEENIPLRVKVAEPALEDRFFVKVIGRGYPTPTNKFRWCTDRLRITPVQRIIGQGGGRALVLLGIRRGESEDRDRTIFRHAGTSPFLLTQSGHASSTIFAPILDYSVEDIWATLHHGPRLRSIDATRLSALYRSTSPECPIVRDPTGTPCGKGRFGCWTCTVVRKDRAMAGLIADGYSELGPLLAFRNWLIVFRDDHTAREKRRRNGQPGLGPFTLDARREILRRLLSAQEEVGWLLLQEDELAAIAAHWRADGGGTLTLIG